MRNTIKKGSGGRGVKGSRERHLNPGTPGQDLRFSRAGLESSNPEIYENYWHTGDEYKFAE
jgi:hypothetical protein